MCGQAGLILASNGRRNEEKLAHLRDVFTRLLALNQFRGEHATGIASVNVDGSYRLLKRPIKASEFVCFDEYRNHMNELSNKTTLIMGHARLATVGSIENTGNCHPIKSGCCLATANGTIFNADELFKKLKLRRFAEVDSELIARLADKHAPDGEILVRNFVHSLRLCRGQISAVVASFMDPCKVIILKGNRPLSLRYSAKYRAIIYSSDELHLDIVLDTDGDWKPLEMEYMSCGIFNAKDLPTFEVLPFNFIRTRRVTISCAK